MTAARSADAPDGPEDWFPAEPYVPGRTPRPSDDDGVHRIAREAPSPTDPAAWRHNRAWLAGLRLYRHGYFWEAHEVWEAVWVNTRPNSAERALVQGVIQLANAGLKQRMGRPGAARRLADLAIGHFGTAGGEGVLMGLDLSALGEAAQHYRRELDADDDAVLPKLDLGY